MTPGALRDWIPAALHGELDTVGVLTARLLAASPSPFVGVWPSHLLAAIEERAVAPWLGVALFLGSDPLAQTGRFRLWDEERDWNRHAVLLGDLARRFGEALVEPLSAVPGPLRPRIVTDWLTDIPARGGPGVPEPAGAFPPTPVDRRIIEAEDAVYRGDLTAALEALLRLWREGGDPLVADVIDVIDPLVGPPMTAVHAESAWIRSGSTPGELDVGRTLRTGILGTTTELPLLLRNLAGAPQDPRIATALRATLLTRDLRGPGISAAADILARTGDVRGLARVAWEHRLPAATAAGMWTSSAGPAGRARLRALARRLGGNVDVPGKTLRDLQLEAWKAVGDDRALAVAVLTDAMREQGDPRVPALGPGLTTGARLRALPARTIERLCERPYGLRSTTASFIDGQVCDGESTDPELALLDPAWGPLQRLTLDGLRTEFASTLPNLRVLLVRAPVGASIEECGAFLTRVNLGRASPIEAVGDDLGLFASVPGRHTAIVTRKVSRLRALPTGAQVSHVAFVAGLDAMQMLLASMPPAVEQITVVEDGIPLVAPVGWSVRVSRERALDARWFGGGPPSPSLVKLLTADGWFRTLAVQVPPTAGVKELRRQLQPLGVQVTVIDRDEP